MKLTSKIKYKEFAPTSWAIDNKTSIYVIVVLITIIGLMNYMRIPKEMFPEVVIPTIVVNTIYPGTSPEDMENLVTRPIEKQAKALAGVKKITSNSIQDFSTVVVEFNTDVNVPEAKQRVKDAVDKAKPNLPNNLLKDPDVIEVDLSEIPIMYINISGNYDLQKLKQYAEIVQDRVESLKEITRVDIVGALEREIQVDVDMYKMQSASLTLTDIERAISAENVIVSAGNINTGDMKRSLRIVGQFTSPEQIKNIMVKSYSGAILYIKDFAEVKDGFKEQESFARLDNQNVITLNVIKKSGQNLIKASDQIKDILTDLKATNFPKDLNVVFTGDQSRYTRNILEELNNTIVLGFILVTIVLMFFMGFSNAFFVGLSVPLSMFVAYMIMPGIGFTMNMIVMFGFIFALGIIVDDAIVVIENTHRIHRTEPNITLAAKRAAGEVFAPILSGTLTTLAPFFPLAFWGGIVGKFMHMMPVTLILTLFASLFVAYIINPVFAVSFMKHEYDKVDSRMAKKKIIIISGVMAFLALIFYVSGNFGLGNFVIFMIILFLLFQYVIKKLIFNFQNKWWPLAMKWYHKTLNYSLNHRNPYYIFWSTIALMIFSFVLMGIVKPPVLFFPDNQPNNIYVFVKMPVGTDQRVTDSITRFCENKVYKVLGDSNPIVESITTNIALGTGDGRSFDASTSSNKGKITINFVEHKYRNGASTAAILDSIRKIMIGIPGAEITVEKNRMGPPTGKPVNIEITGENLNDLIADAVAPKPQNPTEKKY